VHQVDEPAETRRDEFAEGQQVALAVAVVVPGAQRGADTPSIELT
jgi:hypothetical protein